MADVSWPWPSVAHWPQAAAATPVVEGFLCGVWATVTNLWDGFSRHSLGEDGDVRRDPVSPVSQEVFRQ